jgi:hypothetical protein
MRVTEPRGTDRVHAKRNVRRTKKEERRPRQSVVPGQAASTPGTLSASETKQRATAPAPRVPSADPAMYAGILGEITEVAQPTTEADPAGIYASLLGGASAVIGPDPHVQIGSRRHPLLVWPLLLGRTGSGRKGEATATAGKFLRIAESDDYSKITVSGLSSGEGLIERISDDRPEQDRRLYVIEAEFASVMARCKRDGSTLAAVLRQAWDGEALAVMNRNQLKASSSHIAITGHISPRELRLRLAEADLSGGTYNRFLPIYVERPKLLAFPSGVGDFVTGKLSARLRECIRAARQCGRIELDGPARRLWERDIYPELTGADDDDEADAQFTRRAAPYCLRIAALLAALDHRSLMGKRDLIASAALVRYSITSARYVLDKQLRDPRLDRISRAIDGAGSKGITRTDISALFSRNVTKEVLDELLADLVSSGEYAITRRSTGGRPAEMYRRVVVSSSFVSTRPHTRPTRPPAGDAEAVIRRYCPDADDAEIKELINRHTKPGIANLAALLTKHGQSGQLSVDLAALRKEHSRARIRQQIDALKQGPECAHGSPGGAAPHPTTGKPLCPQCRVVS